MYHVRSTSRATDSPTLRWRKGRSPMGAFALRVDTGLVRCFCVALAVLAVSATSSPAQVSGTTATLRGSVDDASGGVLPGAAVTLVNSGTRATRTAVTDERGAFTFSSLFAGTYDLTVELS